MKRAWNLTRHEVHYRHEAFSAGLRAAGFDVQSGSPGEVRPGEVVVGWNRYEPNHSLAARVEKAGGIYLAAENGYLGPNGVSPHSMNPRQWFALGLGHHNDSTVVRMGVEDRWAALGVPLQPWRADGGHVLVCPNRPFGTPGRAMPPEWPRDVCRRLAKLTKREIRLRPHPGNDRPRKPLADDLAGAWFCVIWSSSAGVHALVAGIPVICEAPFWIAKWAADATFGRIDDPFMDGDRVRLAAMRRLAHAQFHIDEIATGEPFRRLLG